MVRGSKDVRAEENKWEATYREEASCSRISNWLVAED